MIFHKLPRTRPEEVKKPAAFCLTAEHWRGKGLKAQMLSLFRVLKNAQMLNLFRQPFSCQCYVMRSPYFFVLIFSKLETILKINQKYFEKSLQLSKKAIYLYQISN